MDLHEIWGLEMDGVQALTLLRQTGQASRLEARHLLSVLDSGRKEIPVSLHPLCNRLYLMQMAPGNRLPV